jgi:hypothetical protein
MDLIARNQYRAWAAECRERAREGHGFKATYEWLKLANAWQRLADGGAGEAIPFQADDHMTVAAQTQRGSMAIER